MPDGAAVKRNENYETEGWFVLVQVIWKQERDAGGSSLSE